MNRALSVTRNRTAHSVLAAGAFALSVITLAAVAPSTVVAQAQATPPQIVVSANGEVVISPDRANVQLGVKTQARTAALASADNNRKQTAVLNAIKALGIPASAITTSNYSVSPVQRWDEKERKTVIDGYRVSNIVVVNVAKIDQAGAVIDAALANGANRVAALTFELADPSKAREEAITKAVAQARREAEVAAKAAGGSLGGLLELTVNSYEPPRPVPMFAMARAANQESAPTPVSEGTLTVTVGVTTRWTYNR